MRNRLKIIFSLLILVYPFLGITKSIANPVRQYIEIDRADLKLLIGEKIYNQPGDGCWSCHGAEGMKVDATNSNTSKKNKNIADLRDPTTWTSYKIITKYSGESEMLSQRRSRPLARPRQIAMYLAKKMTSRSLPEIGRRFANRDHTTVIHAVKTITRLSEQDDEMKKNINQIKSLLLEQ